MTGRLLAWLESVGLFLALYLGLPAAGLALDAVLALPHLPVAVQPFGLIPFALGAAGILWSFVLFVRIGRGTPNPWDPPRALVTAGPFAWVRNPIILSHALALLGIGLLLASPATVVVVLVLGIPVQFVVRHEEHVLEARYGDAYRRYRASVPRWIPRPPRQMR